jgi:hypothetical protein
LTVRDRRGRASPIIAEAFTRWTGATCPTDDEGRSRPSIDVRDIGPAECAKVELAPFPRPNQNVIIFRQQWPHKKIDPTRTVLGLTRGSCRSRARSSARTWS